MGKQWQIFLLGLLQKIQNGNQHNLIVSVWLEAVMIIEGIAEEVDASISSLENIGLLEQ